MAHRAFVLGLSGIPASGKTTLLGLLLRDYPQAEAVAYDRFHPGMTEQQIQDWVRRNGDPNEFTLAELIGALTRLTQIRPDAEHRPLVLVRDLVRSCAPRQRRFHRFFGLDRHATGHRHGARESLLLAQRRAQSIADGRGRFHSLADALHAG